MSQVRICKGTEVVQIKTGNLEKIYLSKMNQPLTQLNSHKKGYSHGLVILELQLPSSQFIVLPSLGCAVQGSVGDSDEAPSP